MMDNKIEELRQLLLDDLIQLFQDGKASSADRGVARQLIFGRDSASSKDSNDSPPVSPASTSSLPFPSPQEISEENT